MKWPLNIFLGKFKKFRNYFYVITESSNKRCRQKWSFFALHSQNIVVNSSWSIWTRHNYSSRISFSYTKSGNIWRYSQPLWQSFRISFGIYLQFQIFWLNVVINVLRKVSVFFPIIFSNQAQITNWIWVQKCLSTNLSTHSKDSLRLCNIIITPVIIITYFMSILMKKPNIILCRYRASWLCKSRGNNKFH